MLPSRSGILAEAINTKILTKNHSDTLHSHPDSPHSQPYSSHSHPPSWHSHLVTTLRHGPKWELCRRQFPTLWQRRSPTLSKRFHNVATTLGIGFPGHFTTDFCDFFPLERVTKGPSGIKHTSSLFKRTLFLQLTKVYTNQVKYVKFNLFAMNTIIHFFT